MPRPALRIAYPGVPSVAIPIDQAKVTGFTMLIRAMSVDPSVATQFAAALRTQIGGLIESGRLPDAPGMLDEIPDLEIVEIEGDDPVIG